MKEIFHPITFNTYKHHLMFLKNQLEIWKSAEWEEIDLSLKVLGNNLNDLYTGTLTVSEVCKECVEKLSRLQIDNKDKYFAWLKPKIYKTLVLSDQSEWILRLGKDENRYVHIHPAKYSQHCIRLRSSTLKTVLTVMYHSNKNRNDCIEELQFINQIRTEYLKLSPVKTLQKDRGILRALNLFNENYSHR